MRSPCCLCLPPFPISFSISFLILMKLDETWYLQHDTWSHLTVVLCKSLISVCVYVCMYIPLSLLAHYRVGQTQLGSF
jgi:hypothetical protein